MKDVLHVFCVFLMSRTYPEADSAITVNIEGLKDIVSIETRV